MALISPSPRRRRGVILLIVLSMLALFSIIALTFVLYAQTHNDLARTGRQTEDLIQPDVEPEKLMQFALGNVIFPADPASASTSKIQGLSLIENMYGTGAAYTYPDSNNPFLAAITADGIVLAVSYKGQRANVTTPESALGKNDVQNGIGWSKDNDSVWIDAGFSVMTSKDGRKYKPLFAPLIVDLDSRVNVNVHGNISGGGPVHGSGQGWGIWEVSLAQVLNKHPTEWANLLQGTTTVNGMAVPFRTGRYVPGNDPRAAGLMVSLRGGFVANAAVTAGSQGTIAVPNATGRVGLVNSLVGTASGMTWCIAPGTRLLVEPGDPTNMEYVTVESVDPTNKTFTATFTKAHAIGFKFSVTPASFYAKVDWDASLASGAQGPLVMPGLSYFHPPGQSTTVACPPMSAFPIYGNASTGWENDSPAEWQNHPSLFDLAKPFRYTASNMEALLRYGDTNSPMFSSELQRLCPINFLNPRVRKLVTTHSYHRERPGQTPRVDLNRPLTPYPEPDPSSGQITDLATFNQARTDRQVLAKDIFNALLLSTGVTMPPGPGSLSDASLSQPRKLAQLAVNIVDYIDGDDYMTPFTWTPSGWGASMQETLFGTELPRVVLNEVYGEYTGNAVRMFLEMHNPLYADATLRDAGGARLDSAYQLCVTDSSMTLNGPNTETNVRGDPFPTLQGSALPSLSNFGGVTIPPQGYFVIGPTGTPGGPYTVTASTQVILKYTGTVQRTSSNGIFISVGAAGTTLPSNVATYGTYSGGYSGSVANRSIIFPSGSTSSINALANSATANPSSWMVRAGNTVQILDVTGEANPKNSINDKNHLTDMNMTSVQPWTMNQFAGKTVALYLGSLGNFQEYLTVQSNTANTLTFTTNAQTADLSKNGTWYQILSAGPGSAPLVIGKENNVQVSDVSSGKFAANLTKNHYPGFLVAAPTATTYQTSAMTGPFTPNLSWGGMSYTATSSPPRPPTFVLRRLACPSLPKNDYVTPGVLEDPTMPYNPYITVDMWENVKLFNSTDTTRRSMVRYEPYAGYNSPYIHPGVGFTDWWTGHTCGPTVVPSHGAKFTLVGQVPPASMGAANDPAIPIYVTASNDYDQMKYPTHPNANWLAHLDRQVTNPMELLSVSWYKPHQLTTRFKCPSFWGDTGFATGYTVSGFANKQGGTGSITDSTKSWTPDQWTNVPVTITIPGNGGGSYFCAITGNTSNRLDLRFSGRDDITTVPPNLNGATYWIGELKTIPFSHHAPWFDSNQFPNLYRFFDFIEAGKDRGTSARLPDGRIPGLININTIWDVETLQALCDALSGSGVTPNEVKSMFYQMLLLRSPEFFTVNPNLDPDDPATWVIPNPNPGATVGKPFIGLRDQLASAPPNGIEDTLFRSFNPHPWFDVTEESNITNLNSNQDIRFSATANPLPAVGNPSAIGTSRYLIGKDKVVGLPWRVQIGTPLTIDASASQPVRETFTVSQIKFDSASALRVNPTFAKLRLNPDRPTIYSPQRLFEAIPLYAAYNATPSGPWSQIKSGGPVWEPITNPAIRYGLMTKFFNHLTTRSNVFGVWVTVGFFEVDPVTGALGAEIGRSEGQHLRHRMFGVVDRSSVTLEPFTTQLQRATFSLTSPGLGLSGVPMAGAPPMLTTCYTAAEGTGAATTDATPSTTRLVDGTKGWVPGQWAGWRLKITNTSGAAAGSADVTISNNTSDTLTLATALNAAPANGITTYQVYRPAGMTTVPVPAAQPGTITVRAGTSMANFDALCYVNTHEGLPWTIHGPITNPATGAVLLPGTKLLLDVGTAQETVTVTAVDVVNKTFTIVATAQPHNAGFAMTNHGNPGSQPNFDPRANPAVVRHWSVID